KRPLMDNQQHNRRYCPSRACRPGPSVSSLHRKAALESSTRCRWLCSRASLRASVGSTRPTRATGQLFRPPDKLVGNGGAWDRGRVGLLHTELRSRREPDWWWRVKPWTVPDLRKTLRIDWNRSGRIAAIKFQRGEKCEHSSSFCWHWRLR